MADATGSTAGGGYRQGRRARQQVPRTRRVEITMTDEEDAVLRAAARRAGLAPAAYAAVAALAAARSGPAGGLLWAAGLVSGACGAACCAGGMPRA